VTEPALLEALLVGCHIARPLNIWSIKMLKKKYFKTKDECEVTFELDSVDAESVALVTEVNGWQPLQMTKRRKDGVYYAKMRLPKESEFQFRYLVDGKSWINDSAADAYASNEFGGENGVIITSA